MTTQYQRYEKELADRMIEKWRKESVDSFVELEEAKRELATLRAENERLREALEQVQKFYQVTHCHAIAKEALK